MTGPEQDKALEQILGVSEGDRALVIIDFSDGVRVVKYPYDMHEIDTLGLASFASKYGTASTLTQNEQESNDDPADKIGLDDETEGDDPSE